MTVVRHPARLALVSLASCAVLVCIACSGGGGGGNPTPTPTPTPACTPITDFSLHNLQTAIFTPNCALASCHAAGSVNPTDKPLDLSSATATYANTVGVLSAPSETFNGTQILIVDTASGHASSYLYKKIVNDPGISGLPMPYTGQLLCQQKIDAIAAWIDAGAPNN